MSYITIGNATVPALWMSVVAALLVLSLLYRKDVQIKALNDAVFTYVLVWKLSYIPLSFSAFIAAPLSILYFNGGQVGHLLGIIVAAVQLYRKCVVDEDFLKIWGKLFAFIFFIQALFVKDLLIVLQGIALLVFWQWKPNVFALVLTTFFLQLATQWNSVPVITYGLGVIVIYGLLKYKQQLSSFVVQVLVLTMGAIVIQQTLPEQTKVVAEQRDFTLASLSGETVSLSDYKGKIVVLNFFATWCPPCKAEMPHLQSFQEVSTDDVVLLGVNLTKRDDGVEVLEQFTQDYGVTYPILLDKADEVGSLYDILSIPTTYVLDQEGRVVERIVGPIDRGTLEKITDTLK